MQTNQSLCDDILKTMFNDESETKSTSELATILKTPEPVVRFNLCMLEDQGLVTLSKTHAQNVASPRFRLTYDGCNKTESKLVKKTEIKQTSLKATKPSRSKQDAKSTTRQPVDKKPE